MGKLSPYFARFQLLLFLLLLANGMLFRHSHHLENGRVIVHAHPYNNDSGEDGEPRHAHNQKELLVLDALFHATYVKSENTFTATAALEHGEIRLNGLPDPLFLSDSFSSTSLRGPPLNF